MLITIQTTGSRLIHSDHLCFFLTKSNQATTIDSTVTTGYVSIAVAAAMVHVLDSEPGASNIIGENKAIKSAGKRDKNQIILAIIK